MRGRWPIPGKEPGPVCRDRIEAAVTPGMAAQDPTRRQIAPGARTVRLERLQSIDGAGGREAALRADPGTEQQAVAAHQGDQHAARKVADEAPESRHETQGPSCAASPTGRARHCDSRASISWRAALRNASEAALVKTARSKGARSRTTHIPDARGCASLARRWAAPRISRLIRLRVTARRACRFGTTVPNQTSRMGAAGGSDRRMSSTAC